MKKIGKIVLIFLVLNCLFFAGNHFATQYPTLQMGLYVEKNTIIEVYYSGYDNSFSEDKVLRYECVQGNRDIVLNFPQEDINVIRIDFGDEPMNIVLHELVYKKNVLSKIALSPSNIEKYILFTSNITEMQKQDKSMAFQICGIDGGIIIDFADYFSDYFVISLVVCEILFLLIAVLVVYYGKWVIQKLSLVNKKQAVVISGVLYLAIISWFAIKYKGWFSFDEFYHISTLNPDYISKYEYDRADYINQLEQVICAILGQSDFVVKLVPMLTGVVCFALCLFLAYKLYDNAYWIIAVACVVSFSPYVLFNQFYIRMYIFCELVVLVDCVLFFLAMQTRKKQVKYGCLVIAAACAAWYAYDTKDFSGTALACLAVIGVVYCLLGDKLQDKKVDPRTEKIWISAVVLLIAGAFLISVLIKKNILDFAVLHKISTSRSNHSKSDLTYLLRDFYHSDDLDFAKFVLLSNWWVFVPFLISLCAVIKKGSAGVKVLFLMSGLPLLGYLVFFYDTNQIRSYIAYWPIVCVIAFWAFDKCKIRNSIHVLIIACIICFSYNIDRDFWVMPSIPKEVISMDLGHANACAKTYEREGYEIVTMMTYETQSAYFDLLDADINLNSADIDKYMREFYIGYKLNKILNGDKKYVILMDLNSQYYYNQYRSAALAQITEVDYAGGAKCVVVN